MTHAATPTSNDLGALTSTAAFIDLYRSLWGVLRDEVIKSQRDA